MARLLDRGYIVSLETNGSFSIRDVPRAIIKVIDLKCPDSGEVKANLYENIELAAAHDQFKFVVASRRDFDWAKAICAQHGLFEKCAVLFSPVHGKVSPLELAEWVLEEELPITMQVQMHKVIWGPDQRGV
jgi:7-carboxy-7-deazaguanine synthase